jgi:hypothetical protein
MALVHETLGPKTQVICSWVDTPAGVQKFPDGDVTEICHHISRIRGRLAPFFRFFLSHGGQIVLRLGRGVNASRCSLLSEMRYAVGVDDSPKTLKAVLVLVLDHRTQNSYEIGASSSFD